MSLDIFTQFATDESLENNGTWFPIGGGAELLIARSGNKAYGKKLVAEFERYRSILDLGDDAADAKSDEIMVEVIGSTLLLGWKNLNFKGEVLEYTPANVRKALSLKDFRRLVVKLSEDMTAFKLKEEQAQGEA